MRRIDLVPTVALVALLLGPGGAPVHAQKKSGLEDWDYEELRTGWSVERLTEAADVVGQDGEKIGEVADLIVGPDGKIKKLMIEAGGFLDLGDAHFAYPFEQATFDGPDRIVVALDEDNLEDYNYQVPFSADAVSELGVFFSDQMETHTPMDIEE